MNDYVIVTDSSCDLPASLADEMELIVVPLTAVLGGRQYTNFLDWREIPPHEYFDAMRGGATGYTSAPNVDRFLEAMREPLSQGKDILYLGFSSGLSATYNNGCAAAEELRPQFPERKILTVDTLCASLGQGLIVHLAVEQKKAGKSIEEVRDFVLETLPHLCHWFTVEDLKYLHRGGRVSRATAIVGTILSIKPVLHVDDEGHLIAMGKVRGRMASIKSMFEHMVESVTEPEKQVVYISHGDCRKDADTLAAMIREKLGVQRFVINEIGPVIGGHAGPGTLALFFLGDKR